MSLNAQVLSDLQGDIGITDDETVFTDAQLERLYERAESDLATAVYYAFRQLLANANKLYDYTAGLTSEKRNQVRQNIADSVAMWEKESRLNADQVGVVGATVIPNPRKDRPYSTVTTNNTFTDYDGEL